MTDARPERPRILAVFAHPDDEVFAAGGTLAKYAAEGAETMVVSATRGQAGRIRDARSATRGTLGAVREDELRRACAILGVQHVECLDFMDGSLNEAPFDALVGAVVRVIRAFRPIVVITFGDDGAYGHPDHVTISAAATRACALAGDPTYDADRSQAVGAAHAPTCLYHSHFAHSRLLLLDRLALWLVSLDSRFRGSPEFVQSLALFAEESTTLRYAGVRIDVRRYSAGFSIIEQGETGTSLFLIVSGEVDVAQEDGLGVLRALRRMGPGEFFGELAVASHQLRSAHVIAATPVTCLVFSPAAPTAFDVRGAVTRPSASATADGVEWHGTAPTTCIDVSAHVEQKLAAIAAHRTQFPIQPGIFPPSMVHEMLDREYFVRVFPARELESTLLPPVLAGRRA
jgi:LmbE family N-acetylglucosaminyl deacetylase